jgi:exodeoxyribonuclease VII large subunit
MLERKKMILKVQSENLRNLNPLAILDRGYSIVQDISGKIIKSSKNITLGDSVNVTLYKGAIGCEVKTKN